MTDEENLDLTPLAPSPEWLSYTAARPHALDDGGIGTRNGVVIGGAIHEAKTEYKTSRDLEGACFKFFEDVHKKACCVVPSEKMAEAKPFLQTMLTNDADTQDSREIYGKACSGLYRIVGPIVRQALEIFGTGSPITLLQFERLTTNTAPHTARNSPGEGGRE